MLVQIFKEYDTIGDGRMQVDDLRKALHVQGREDEDALDAFLQHVAVDSDDTLDYMEFLLVFSGEIKL